MSWFVIAWHWLANNSQGVATAATLVLSFLTLIVVWRTQVATKAQAKAAEAQAEAGKAQAEAAKAQAEAAKTQNNMSIKTLNASVGAADRQLWPLLTVKKKSVRANQMDPSLVEVAEIRNEGLGPALGINVFFEARKVDGEVHKREDCQVETTFLALNGTITVPLTPNLFIFQPLVIEYLSAMNTKHETRYEFGEVDIQSHRVLHSVYEELSDLRFD